MKKLVKIVVIAVIVVIASMNLTGCSAADNLNKRTESHAEDLLVSLMTGDERGLERSLKNLERDYNIACLMEDGIELVEEVLTNPWFWVVTVIIPLLIGIGGAIFALIDAPTRGRNVLFCAAICFLFHIFGLLFYIISNVDYPKKKAGFRTAVVTE